MVTRILEVGRFGSVRDTLIKQDHIVGAWSLQETARPRATCLVFDRNHGTWGGTGTVRGVPLTSIPDPELGATFDGNGFVTVPNDGIGFSLPGDSGDRTLSLANGRFDVLSFLRTMHSSATLRLIAGKQDTDSNGNGYYLGYQNAQLRAFLKVGGSVVFDFGRDYPLDDREHVAQLCVQPNNSLVRLILDGWPMGSDVSASTEPALTTGAFRIAQFLDGAGGFIGTLGLVAISREGNLDLCQAVHRSRTWSPITPDIRTDVAPLEVTGGASDPWADVAAPLRFTCALDNSDQNEAKTRGYYTPESPTAMAGWVEQIPIRYRVIDEDGVEHIRFRGIIDKIDVTAGSARDQSVTITAMSWFAHAMQAAVRQLSLQTDLTSGEAIRRVIDQSVHPPPALAIDVGDSTFPIVFDGLSPETKIYQELGTITSNEGGRLYERADGTVVFEAGLARYLQVTPTAIWKEEDLEDLEPTRGRDAIRNAATVTITPRRLGATATQDLAVMTARVPVEPGEILPLELPYRHPDQTSAPIGGVDVTVPVAITDYTMTEGTDGTGADLTAFAVVTPTGEDLSGSGASLRVQNTHATHRGYLLTRVRGRTVDTFQPQGLPGVRDEESIRRFKEQILPFRFEYQANVDEALGIARRAIALRKVPTKMPQRVVRRALDPETERDVLARDVGDLVSISEPMADLTGTERIFIQGYRITEGADNSILAEYTLSRAQAGQNYWIVGDPVYGIVGEALVA